MTATLHEDATTTVIPGAGQLVRVRTKGYYKDIETGAKYTSVTTILDRNVAKHLQHWAGNMVARCAMDNLPYLVKSSRNADERIDAYEWLKKAHERKKNERGDIGTAIHSLIEARILGTPLAPEVGENPEFLPYLRCFDDFVREWKVEFTASEMIVANATYGYGGTLDTLLRSALIAEALGVNPALDIAEDTKTGGELDVKGVYPEAALQMSAYAHAEFAQTRAGRRVKMPPVADCGVVLHLRPEGYRLIPMEIGAPTFEQFLALVRLDRNWTRGLSKQVVGPALNLPTWGE
jgi:hypothetical protein